MPATAREHVATTSADPTADRIAALKGLFPDAFADGKLDVAKLRAALSEVVASDGERYTFSWAGRTDAVETLRMPTRATLLPVPEQSVDFDTTKNLYVEGDNLEVLKLLYKPYAGRVKLIYIDPPYNTGNDFIYPDDFRDTLANYLKLTNQTDDAGNLLRSNPDTSGRYHSDWLSMMYPRLFLARQLLRDDGVIFVSIDDHEVHHLRLLMNEVFGEENFVACLVWERGRKNDARRFSVGHEYILCFARDLSFIEDELPPWRETKIGVAEIVEEYERLKQLHGQDFKSISDGLVAFYRSLPEGHFSKKYSRSRFVDERGIWRDNNISWPGGGGPKYALLHPVTEQPCKVPEDGWRFVESTMEEKVRSGYVEFREDHTKTPFLKSYLYVDSLASASEVDERGEKLQVMGRPY